ncbi:hypothetical protein DFA_06827 [Cavenderia fasciculata]|uniref:Transmembrane protein n=1 Tax=Cavenderia fasciculata TaxID=261658 RepID=F4Q2E0_CACFS|nr:uncharacterized protein DFA_06827 [Cavenderia fasciculata]EGG18160.1 hypothetical protein DFA_06827 [Cavenderia fasciculata]|eukprot:XP_004366201.1 hypothetical protein DFA_06827 [Cavenderia fasciculata]
MNDRPNYFSTTTLEQQQNNNNNNNNNTYNSIQQQQIRFGKCSIREDQSDASYISFPDECPVEVIHLISAQEHSHNIELINNLTINYRVRKIVYIPLIIICFCFIAIFESIGNTGNRKKDKIYYQIPVILIIVLSFIIVAIIHKNQIKKLKKKVKKLIVVINTNISSSNGSDPFKKLLKYSFHELDSDNYLIIDYPIIPNNNNSINNNNNYNNNDDNRSNIINNNIGINQQYQQHQQEHV